MWLHNQHRRDHRSDRAGPKDPSLSRSSNPRKGSQHLRRPFQKVPYIIISGANDRRKISLVCSKIGGHTAVGVVVGCLRIDGRRSYCPGNYCKLTAVPFEYCIDPVHGGLRLGQVHGLGCSSESRTDGKNWCTRSGGNGEADRSGSAAVRKVRRMIYLVLEWIVLIESAAQLSSTSQ